MPTKEEILKQKELEDKASKAEALQAELKKFTDEQAKKDKELEELKKFKKEQEAKLAEAQAEADKAKKEKYIQELKSEKLCTPSMEKYALALLSDKKNYSIDEKEMSKEDILKEMLKLFKQANEVNFDENSLEGEKKNHTDEDAIEKKIDEYQKENKVDYSTAYRAVINEIHSSEDEADDEQ